MAKSSEWNLIRGVRSNPGRGIEFELGKNNWETRREGGNFYRSIYSPLQAEIFLRADGREYLYARLFRIKSDYILPRYLCLPNRRNLHGKHEAVVAPLTFEFSRSKERERLPIRVKLQIQHRPPPRVISTSRKFLPDNFMPRSCITLTTFFPPPSPAQLLCTPLRRFLYVEPCSNIVFPRNKY